MSPASFGVRTQEEFSEGASAGDSVAGVGNDNARRGHAVKQSKFRSENFGQSSRVLTRVQRRNRRRNGGARLAAAGLFVGGVVRAPRGGLRLRPSWPAGGGAEGRGRQRVSGASLAGPGGLQRRAADPLRHGHRQRAVPQSGLRLTGRNHSPGEPLRKRTSGVDSERSGGQVVTRACAHNNSLMSRSSGGSYGRPGCSGGWRSGCRSR